VLRCEEQEVINNIGNVKKRRFVALWGNGDYGRVQMETCLCFGFRRWESSRDCVWRSSYLDPVEVSGLPKDIVKISAGYYHSSAITESGELYMWGKNSSGQLGLGRKASKVIPVPCKVDFLNGVPIKMAALGSDHSIAVTDKGELGWRRIRKAWSWTQSKPLGIFEFYQIKSVAAGMLHSACIDESGSVYVFGEKAVQKLASRTESTVSTPSMIGELPYSQEVACGAHHTCVITSGGELYTWGSNENGCLGTGDTHAVLVPERVEGPFIRNSVSKVSCGWKHTAAISGPRG
ncbi:hypothetical protein M8C21_025550, partial [Ambrosia artemisiifolia]